MWCVASAPIVPLARDLDAALGMPRGELAVHFRKLSTSLPTTPLPSRAAPAFFPQGALPLSRPPSLSRAAPAFLPHTAHTAPTLCGLVSAPSRTCATSRPTARRSLRMATAAMGPFFRKHKKRAPFLGERCSFWVAKRSTFGRVVLTCATMGGHTGWKLVRRRGLACATCAVDLIDATLYFGIAAGESIFAHLSVAIDAAHHFAGGLFHTARGRLCGRGGRGRRRGGRARR